MTIGRDVLSAGQETFSLPRSGAGIRSNGRMGINPMMGHSNRESRTGYTVSVFRVVTYGVFVA